MTKSCLYFGRVVHQRRLPFAHRLDYRVFSLYLDIGEVAQVSRRLRLFSHNRWNLFSFHDRDHGAEDGGDLRSWIDRRLAEAGIDLQGGSVRLLCFPRLLGYAFNPLAIWFCYHRDGRLLAVLYEVRNTFGQKHGYLISVDPARAPGDPVEQACDKGFYVSPFIEMAATYHFRLQEPDERLSVLIRQRITEGEILMASQVGRRQPLDDKVLLRAFFAFPLMTLKVIAAIHWQALKIWRKGAKLQPRPPAPEASVTLVCPATRQAAE
ncbi:MAG: DUF1365 domain-containing protein [Pseudomonadota bacterium]